MTMTRRGLLGAMTRLGGIGAAYETLSVMEFLKPPPALAADRTFRKDSAPAGRAKLEYG